MHPKNILISAIALSILAPTASVWGAPIRQAQQRQQQNSITGTVVDDKGEPLAGAYIAIGGQTVAVTDIYGQFAVYNAAPDGREIQVSFVGMATKTVKAAPGNMLIEMSSDDSQISEVVVNGFFSRNRQTFTGVATTVTGDELLSISPTNILQSLAQLDPSLSTPPDNAAGSNPNRVPDLVIRSTTSLATNNEVGLNAPLIVIDGVEQDLQALYDIDINDIERVDILKDASATALYGENAANGVIVIQRKRVSQSALRIRYTVTPSFSFADLSSYNLMNARQKLELERLAGLYTTIDGSLDNVYYERLALVSSGVDTDWKTKPIRNSFSHQHSLSISGRGSGLDYNITGNYSNVQGVMKDDQRERYGMNVYLSYTAVDKLVLTLRAQHEQLNQRNSKYGTFSEYLLCNPYDSPYDERGNLRRQLSWSRNNPLYEASLSSFDRSDSRSQTVSLDIRYNFMPNLYVTAQGSYVTSRGKTDRYISPESNLYTSTTVISQRGSYTVGNSESNQWGGKFVGNYIHSFDDDEATMATLNLGGEIKKQDAVSSSLTGTGFLNDNQSDIAYATAYPQNGHPSGTESLSTSVGAFVAANFMWRNRYVVDGSYRLSGSSKFGVDQRWAPFWSAGLGWNLHNEEFVKTLGVADVLRVRGSYGYTGSVKFDSFQAVTTYQYDGNLAGVTGVGAVPRSMANPDLKWQTTKKFNVGLVSTFLRNRLNINFDYYVENTTDMLIDRSLPPSSGATSVKANVGSQTSRGVEFSVWGKVIQIGDWEWNLSANGLHSKTTINNISDALRRRNESNASSTTSVSPLVQYREGESPTAIYAVRSAGIDPASGREIFIKADGSYTYDYDSQDQVPCGDTNPALQGSFATLLRWRQLSLSVSFSYRFGGEMYNSTRVQKVERINPRYNADIRAFEGRWKQPGDVVPYIDISTEASSSYTYSSRFVEKDNELILSSAYVQYEFKPDLLRKLRMQKFYVGLSTEELFRVTAAHYERGTSYPFSRSFSLTASVTF